MRIRIGKRFVVIRVIGRILVAVGTRAEFLDPELVHHVLMVLLGGKIRRRRCIGGRTERRISKHQNSGNSRDKSGQAGIGRSSVGHVIPPQS